MKKLLSIALCLSLLLGLLSSASLVSADLSYDNETAEEIIVLLNAERAKVSLKSLKTAPSLNEAARQRAYEISQVFGHTRPNGYSCFSILKDYFISYYAVGENIARGYVDAQSAIDGWMESPGHKENMLESKFTHVGVGVYGRYYVQIFVGLNGSYTGEYHITPSLEKAKSVIGHLYPLASDSQISKIYNDLNSSTDSFSFSDLASCASKLKYEPETDFGDVNGDGEVDEMDAMLVSRYSAGLLEFNSEQIAIGDINGDGEIDEMDAMKISRTSAGLE